MSHSSSGKWLECHHSHCGRDDPLGQDHLVTSDLAKLLEVGGFMNKKDKEEVDKFNEGKSKKEKKKDSANKPGVSSVIPVFFSRNGQKNYQLMFLI